MRAAVAAAGKRAGGLLAAGMHGVLGSRAGDRVAILMYHRVAEERAGVPAPTWNVTPRRFREHMEGLLAAGCRVASLRAAVEASREGRAMPAGTVVITFDDGYRNNHLHAWPVLRELRLHATIFVPTAFVGSAEPLPFDGWGLENRARVPADDWQALTWAECHEMEASGVIEIGSHSHRHLDFRGDAARFRADADESAATLRSQLAGPHRDLLFAFPYGGRDLGYASDQLVDVARSAGFACALTTETELVDPRTSPFGWGRLEAVASDTGATLAAKVAGWYEWMGAARRVFRMIAPPGPGNARP